MSEADILRMIEEKYLTMPKAEWVEILFGMCETDPEFKKYLKKLFPKFYKEIYGSPKKKKGN